MDEATRIANCPTPGYHETHRYCPSCPWTEPRPTRDDLTGKERAVNDALDGYLLSFFGVTAGHTHWEGFLIILIETGYQVTAIPNSDSHSGVADDD